MTHVVSITPPPDALQFYVVLPDNSRYAVDLREFAYGGDINQVPSKARHAWRGDFEGRPVFAHQLARLLKEEPIGQARSVNARYGLRELFRFLDHDQANGGDVVLSLADVTDAHGVAFIEWLGETRNYVYKNAKSVLDAMRRLYKLPKLFWPARDPDRIESQEPISNEATRAIYSALKSEVRDLKAMFKEGAALALDGSVFVSGDRRQHWSLPQNRAKLVATATSDRLLYKSELVSNGLYRPLVQNIGPGPSYIAPRMGERAETGWSAALRWFHPGLQDTALLLWLFLIGTGWNLSTALSLDVSREENWCEPHPSNNKFSVIHAFKARADRHQFTLSMTKPEWHPYQIVRYAIEITKTLRATVVHRIEEARALYSLAPSQALAAKIAELEKTAKSPWLYQLSNKLGEVSSFEDMDSTLLGPLIREVARRHDLLDQFPELSTLATSDPRDTWIGNAYVKSGFHVLITQLASQHASAKTLKHYLKSRRYREHSELRVREMQDALFGEISAGRIVDPTRLHLLVNKGSITEEQEARLLDVRQRTVMGTGCLNPTEPPRSIAPDHAPGTLCRVQRCTGCQHGVVFLDSIGHLARAYAELLQIQRKIPLAAWMGSSFEDELVSISETLKAFPTRDVQMHVASWTEKFENGTLIHDTYPSYR